MTTAATATTQPTTEPTAGAPAPDTSTTSEAEFASVFDSLMDKDGTTNEPTTSQQTDPSDHTAGATDDAQQPAQPADGTGGTGEPAPTGTDATAGDDQGLQNNQGTDAAGSGAVSQNDLSAQLAALQAQLAALQSAPATAATAATAAPAPAAEEPKPIYTAAEQTELVELQKEWPDLHRMFTLMARQVQHETLTYAFSEMERVLTPLQSSVGTLAGNEHMAAIYEAHEDYDQVYQPVMEWIEKQPSFLKAAYQNVVKQGTAQDVAEMISRFKTEMKWQAAPTQGAGTSQQTAPATPAPAAPATPELSITAMKAATAIGAVGTKRSGMPTAQDPLDFDGGWEEALATK
jgi:hypothetical protein